MKKMILFLIVAVFCCFAVSANANVTCSYDTTGLNTLDHAQTYTWGVDLCKNQAFTPGCTITAASLTFTDIKNSDNSTNTLYIHLLNTDPALDVKAKPDGGFGDQFAGKGPLIAMWSTNSTPSTKVFTFSQSQLNALNSCISGTDTIVGFGIDPDCHYTNTCCEFQITCGGQPTVPAPGAVLLGGIGTCIVGWLRSIKTL